MNISPIFNLTFSQNKYSNIKMQNNNASADISIKSNPSFKSNIELKDLSFDSFNNWAINSGYISKISKNLENLRGIMLGEGAEGFVYEIPETDDWVLKEYKRSTIVPIFNESTAIKPVKDILPSMNIGQTIGQVQIPFANNYSQVFYVRKKQTGFELGVGRNDLGLPKYANIQTHLDTLKILAAAPQSTYDKLVKDVKKVHEKGLAFDCYNPNNFLYNPERQSINFVDIDDGFDGNDSQFGNILYALLDTTFYLSLNEDNLDEKAVIDASKIYAVDIVSKFLNSMQKEKVKFDNTEQFNKLIKSDLLEIALKGKRPYDRDTTLRNMHLL
ncbi:hypothetical protein IJD44_08590 [bacterium]|nr:hypothetical protein [bacterium]